MYRVNLQVAAKQTVYQCGRMKLRVIEVVDTELDAKWRPVIGPDG